MHNARVSFLANYVEERPWRAIKSPNNGGKKKVKGEEERGVLMASYEQGYQMSFKVQEQPGLEKQTFCKAASWGNKIAIGIASQINKSD